MKWIRGTVEITLAMVWLLALAAKAVLSAITDEMRTALGKDGEPISTALFLAFMTAAVFLTGATGTLICLLKNY